MEHYFTKKPKSIARERTIHYSHNSTDFSFYTSSSVFSKDSIDKGTELLINESQIAKNSKILDLGCGYGAVGIILSKVYPDSKITMSDINERAVSLAKRNADLNKVAPDIIQTNLYEDMEEKFDIILTNPPQSAGKKICFEIIEEAPFYLKKNGTLQLVARHKKGGKDLSKKMKEIFGNVETIARKSGYHIYLSKN